MSEHHPLFVYVNDTLTLDAGWWEETMEETTSGNMLPCRLIHPPAITMYDQVLHYLGTISHNVKVPPKSHLNFGEVALATIAVCLRWGTYFAVLADKTKPIWGLTKQEEISMLGDAEMARINIEASGAFAQWIEFMRTNDSSFRKMVKAAQNLPMHPHYFDDKTNNQLFRNISFINSAQSRQNFFTMLKEQYGDEWFEQKEVSIMPDPIRWLANGLINTYWRNGSGIEDIHAGKWVARPLLQRRFTSIQEYTLMEEIAKGIVPSMHALYNVFNKKGEDSWKERVFSLAINFSPPHYWSLTERTTEVLLEGGEPLLKH